MKTTRFILRIHGTVLVIATIALTIVGWMGYCCGLGTYGHFLLKEPIGYIGLFQAYLLMTTIGITLLVGSFSSQPQKFHWLGIGAHLAPLVANFIFWTEIETYGITHAGIALHTVMISLETFGLLKTDKK